MFLETTYQYTVRPIWHFEEFQREHDYNVSNAKNEIERRNGYHYILTKWVYNIKERLSVEEGNLFYIYPDTIQAKGTVAAYYIKKPSDVVWGFTPGSLGQYTYSPAASTDFELDAIEQTEVILNILMYAGVIIRDPQIVQAAASEIQQNEINQKS